MLVVVTSKMLLYVLVLQAGYMLHERVIRPAEVGVTEEVDNKEAEQGSEA